MKAIRIILMILVVLQARYVYGASPEFYGIYASNNNKLIEMAKDDKNKPPYDFGQNVQFLVYQKQAEMYANRLTIMRAIFVRTINNPGMKGDQPPKNVNTWKPRRDGTAVATRTKPVAGQPEQIYVVPREPLPAGMYILNFGDRGGEIGKFYVNKDQVVRGLERGEDCIDIVVGKGWASYEYDLSEGRGGEVVPCSNSSPTTSGSNAIPGTATVTGTNAGASGKVSRTQEIDAAKALSKYIDSPAMSEEEEKRFMREEAARAARFNSPDLLRLKQSRRDALKRNDYQGIIDPSLQILQIDSADYESLDYLANLYTAVNEPDKALVYASVCLKRVVRPRTFSLITQAYLMKKDKKNTLLWLEKTLQSKYPYHPPETVLNQAFPKDQGEISNIFNKYRSTSGTSTVPPELAGNQPDAAQNAQPQTNVVEGVASVFKSIFSGVKSALPRQDAAETPSISSQAAAEAPTSATASVPPEKATLAGWEAIVSGGKLGEFGHGTKVSKTKKGELVLASSNNPMTHTHPGVDILAKCGSPIYPVADGEVFDVISSKDDGDYGEDGKKGLGYMTIVKHDAPTNTYSLYLHMQEEPSVKPGNKVVAGKTILGKVGKTGAAWGCHTHFEVRHFGTRYLTDKGWNYPANIYGKGEQPQRLAKFWEDPLAIGASPSSASLARLGVWKRKSGENTPELIEISNSSEGRFRVRVAFGDGNSYYRGIEYFGKVESGSIVATGNASDFYKFEFPRFRIAGETMRRTDGSTDQQGDAFERVHMEMPPLKYLPPSNED